MPGTCNDCGASFKGDVKAHVEDAHPGLPRFRFRAPDGTSHIVCPNCGFDIEEGGPRHLKSAGGLVTGKSSDPIDLFAAHMMSHEGEA